MNRISTAPRVFLEVLSDIAGRKSKVSVTDLRTAVEARGYTLTKTNAKAMSASDVRRAILRAQNWLAENVMLDAAPSIPSPHDRVTGGVHAKPKRKDVDDNGDAIYPEGKDGTKKFKTAMKKFITHRDMVVVHLFSNPDGNSIKIPEIEVPTKSFINSSDLYSWLGAVSGSSEDYWG